MSEEPDITKTTNTAYFCPQCSSPQVEHGGLTPASRCLVCGWRGSEDDLVGVPFAQDLGSDAAILDVLGTDLRNVIARASAPAYLQFLLKWGFMSEPNPKVLARYLQAVGRATLRALIEERAAIEEEAHAG